jgi:hypothetical protein
MDENKRKEGVSVKEIEAFARQHKAEVFFCLVFLLAMVFSHFSFFRPGWSLFGAGAGAILGTIFPAKVDGLLKGVLQFIFKQESTLQIVLGVGGCLLAIFLPLVIFFALGCAGGVFIYTKVNSRMA